MRSFLQYLKEEEQQNTLAGWWFRARSTWGGSGQDQNAGAPAVLGGVQTWGGSPFVRMLNMPQFILDMFDYNGDGSVEASDVKQVQCFLCSVLRERRFLRFAKKQNK